MNGTNHAPRHGSGKPDRRYSIAREYCGYSAAQWVVRFCGDWVGSAPGKPDALAIARAHQQAHYRTLGVPHPAS